MKITAKVISVGQLRTTQSGKELVDINVEDVNNGQQLKVACFLGNNGDPTKVNADDRFEMEVDSKSYKGKMQYSTGLWLMKKVEKPQPLPQEEEVDWDAKERRGHRRACLAIASSMLTDEQKSKLGAPDVEVFGMVQLIAVKLLNFVYEEENEITQEAPF